MVLRRRGPPRLIISKELKIRDRISKTVHYKSYHGGLCQEWEEGSIDRNDDRSEDIALVALLKKCADEKDVYNGNKLHADILKRGSLENNIFIGSSFVNLYAKCGALAKAQQVLGELPVSHVVSWNSLIAGYAQHEHGEEALKCFEQMLCTGVSPDPVTFACILKACGSVGAIAKGKEIHAEVVRQGLLGTNVVVGIAPGAVISGIDGISTNGLGLYDAAQQLQVPENSEVKLTVCKEFGPPIMILLVSERIKINLVSRRLCKVAAMLTVVPDDMTIKKGKHTPYCV